MSNPAVGNLINLSFSQTEDSPLALPGNSRQIYETRNHSRDFNINLNKTYDFSKNDEHMTASGGIETIFKPFGKLTFDSTDEKKNVSRKPSHSLDLLESDESLGLIPDLLNDKMNCDVFKTGLDFSDDDTHDMINPEINKNPASFVYSPPSDNQFNRISLFLKNISTPLPNFMVDRRCSSTPKILPAIQFDSNVSDNIKNNLPTDFLSEKEEPIAGSSFVKFQADFNLIDFNDVKPLTSTCKEIFLPQLPFVKNESEAIGVKSEVIFPQRPETIQNNLNVTQTISNVEYLISCDNTQNGNILNNTFQIKQSVLNESADPVVSLGHSIPTAQKISQLESNEYLEKGKVKTLDSTFEIPSDKILRDVNREKTFVIDYDSKSSFKDGTLNDTHVLEIDSIEGFSKQQLHIANATFTKELENDTPISFENRCYSPLGFAFKPLTQILEETFTESDLSNMEVHNKIFLQLSNGKSELPAFPEIFSIKENVTFSEKDEEILPDMKVTENDNYPTELASPNSPQILARTTFNKEMGEKVSFYNENLIENGPTDKTLHSDVFQSINEDSFSKKTNKRAGQEIDKFYEKNLIQNENQSDMTFSSLSKAVKSFTICDGFEEVSFHEQSVFQDSKALVKQDVVSLQPILPGKTSNSMDLNQSDYCHTGTNFPKATPCGISTVNTFEETEFCSQSIPKEDCSLDLLTKSPVTCVFTTFSEKINQAQSDKNAISTANDQVQTSRNSLKEMSNSTFSEKTGDVQIELDSLLTEKDKFQASMNSIHITNAPFSKLADQDIEVRQERDLHDRDSVSKTASTDLTKFHLTDNLSKKDADKKNSSKSCSLESKFFVKSRLMKPTRIVHPIKVSGQHDGQLHVAQTLHKPNSHKRADSSVFNRTLNLCDSTDKLSSEGFNRRLTLCCSSTRDDNKSECKNGFKKPLEIPLKLGIKRPGSTFQKSRPDIKYSHGHLRNINTINEKQNLLTQADLVSDKDPKIIKSVGVASVYKKVSISSRLSLPGKMPIKSLKLKECGLKTEISTTEKNTSKVMSEIGIKNANPGDKRSSIAINFPRQYPKRTSISKLTVSEQKSAPGPISYKRDSIKASGSKMLPKSTAQLKFSSLSKCQSSIKMPLGGSEKKSVVNKSPALGNQNSKCFLKKPIISKCEPRFGKQKDNTRENNRSNSSMVPPPSRQVVKPLNAPNIKKSNGQCNFLPVPKIIKGDVKSGNSNDAHIVKVSEFQNQVCRRIPGKLPQFKRNPAPRCNK